MPATSLTVIHKYLRREMFDLSERLFRAGPEQIPEVQAAFQEITRLLHGHAAYEDAHVLPLLSALDSSLEWRLSADHHQLHEELEQLNSTVLGVDARAEHCTEALLQLHLDWNRYLSRYLAHLDEEERALHPSLADLLPLADIAKSAAGRGEEGRIFLARVWAVTTAAEREVIEQASARMTFTLASAPLHGRAEERARKNGRLHKGGVTG